MKFENGFELVKGKRVERVILKEEIGEEVQDNVCAEFCKWIIITRAYIINWKIDRKTF